MADQEPDLVEGVDLTSDTADDGALTDYTAASTDGDFTAGVFKIGKDHDGLKITFNTGHGSLVADLDGVQMEQTGAHQMTSWDMLAYTDSNSVTATGKITVTGADVIGWKIFTFTQAFIDQLGDQGSGKFSVRIVPVGTDGQYSEVDGAVGGELTPWRLAGTGTNTDRDAKTAWSTPGNITADDGSTASVNLPTQDYSDWLEGTNFGFNTTDIPSGKQVDGVEARIRRFATEILSIRDDALFMLVAGAQAGDDKSAAGTWPAAAEPKYYGGPADLWGATPDDADVRASNFGLRLSVFNNNSVFSRNGEVDAIWMRVKWSDAPAAGGHDYLAAIHRRRHSQLVPEML